MMDPTTRKIAVGSFTAGLVVGIGIGFLATRTQTVRVELKSPTPYEPAVVEMTASPSAVNQWAEQLVEAERKKKAADEEGRAYVRAGALVVSNVVWKDGSFGGRALAGELRNAGTRDVRRVTFRLYYLDASGARIGEKTEDEFVDPLRPNYRCNFRVDASMGSPPGWADCELTIDTVELAEAAR